MQKHYQKEEMDDLYLNRKQVEDEVPENVLDNGYLLEIEQEQEEEKDLLNKNIPIIVPKKQKKA